MNKEQIRALGLIESPERKPHFESELQRKEYEQTLQDIHCCKDRRSLIHSKRGGQIVLLYMQVRQVGPQQAMRELITDEAYTLFVCP